MVTVNLIPESIRLAQARRLHIKRWAVCLALSYTVAVIPAVAHWRQHMRVDALRSQNDQLQTDLAATRAELKTTTATANEIFLRIERAKALRSKRAWSSMLALIGDCLPRDCWLTALATDPDVPSAAPNARSQGSGAGGTSPIPDSQSPEKQTVVTIDAPRKLRMSGSAVDASLPLSFVARLKESRVFRDVTLERCLREPSSAAEGEGESNFRFDLVCEW